MTGDRDLARGVARLMALLCAAGGPVLLLAGRPADAAGLVAGTVLVVANFAGLRATVGRLSPAGGVPGVGRRALWVGVSTARLGALGLAVGALAAGGGLGLPGLLLALLAFPLTVVAAGLRGARAA